MEWVFGYGSLADPATLAAWLGRGVFEPGETALLRLPGYRRAWNVARDNAVIRAGRPYYVDARTGERAGACVVVVNLRPASGEAANGMAFRVSRADLEKLDRRELNYDRIDASGLLDRPLPGRVWLYRGSAAARACYERAAAEGRAVVARGYFAAVEAAFAAHGGAFLAEYRAGTDPPAVPLADLRRTDWPDPGGVLPDPDCSGGAISDRNSGSRAPQFRRQ